MADTYKLYKDAYIVNSYDSLGNPIYESNPYPLNIFDAYGNKLEISVVENAAGTEGDDNIENYLNDTMVSGYGGNDFIINNSNNVIVNTGTGDDFVDNIGNQVSINGGSGNDYIFNEQGSYNVSIAGGEGNDSISNDGDNVTIDGGADDDYISNTGSNVVINGGAGNDSVQIGGADNTINVSEGNDTILVAQDGANFIVEDFRAGDAIVLAEAVDSLKMSDGKIIAGNATIGGMSGAITEGSWTLDGDVAICMENTSGRIILAEDGKTISYVSGSGEENLLATVSGVVSTDGLLIDTDNKTVTVSAISLSRDSTVEVSEDYTLVLGEDVPTPTAEQAAGWRFSGNTATYVDGTTKEGYVIKDNQIVYSIEGTGQALVKVSGLKSADELEIDTANKIVTIPAATLGTETVTVSDDYTLALASDVPQPIQGKVTWRITSNSVIGQIAATEGGYKLENNQIVFVESGANNNVVIYGLTSSQGLSLEDNGDDRDLQHLFGDGGLQNHEQ